MEFRKKGFGYKAVLFVAFASLIVGVAISTRFDLTTLTNASGNNLWKDPVAGQQKPLVNSNLPNFVDLAKKHSPTVVNIYTTQVLKERQGIPFPEFRGPFDDFFNDDFNKFFGNQPKREFKRQSLGSGFIINKEGYILTNNHVIENATEIRVSLSADKKEFEARKIGADQKLDIALIKIEINEELPVATLGNSEDLQIGEWVVAIGNPFGLGGTVTAGIVSQKGRVIGAGPYDNFIQTDASINPGNSGGPLFNIRGEVVGINTAIIAGGQGIGFATPINMVKEVITQLKEKGKVTRGWIGVGVQELTPDLAKKFGLKDAHGVLVSSVNPGDPAEAAGFKVGDIILSYDGKSMNELGDIPRAVAATTPGKVMEVKVLRDGKEVTLSVKVGTKPDEETAGAGTDESKGKDNGAEQKFGMSVQPMTPELSRRLGIKDSEGVYVTSVQPESSAAAAGVKRGDIIKEINRKPIKSIKDFNQAIKGIDKKDATLLLVQRGNMTLFIIAKFKD